MGENENGSDSYSRFGRLVAEQMRRRHVNTNELDKRGPELAERAVVAVRSRI